jgi:hypothetical protein
MLITVTKGNGAKMTIMAENVIDIEEIKEEIDVGIPDGDTGDDDDDEGEVDVEVVADLVENTTLTLYDFTGLVAGKVLKCQETHDEVLKLWQKGLGVKIPYKSPTKKKATKKKTPTRKKTPTKKKKTTKKK